MEKLNSKSLNFTNENIIKLKTLFPEIVVDGKIDFDALKILLGEQIDASNEKYQLTWNGKTVAKKNAITPSASTLIPVDVNPSSKNVYIEGDNVEVLKVLQKTYSNKIDMIYIDPPYNTGNDFVYKDTFENSIDNYKEITNQQSRANPEASGRYHTDWLNMIYPRLELAKNLLSESGVIVISIDDHEIDNLKKVCNEIFGDSNYVACVVWERAFSPVNLKKHFSESHDYILFYAKNIDKLVCNGLRRTGEANDRYSNPDNDPRGPWTSGDLSVGPRVESRVYEITTPLGRKILPPSGYCWRLDKETFEKYKEDNRIWFGDGTTVPRLKRFLSEVKQGITPMTIWKYSEVGHSQDATKYLKKIFDDKAYFDYPKPINLMKRIIELYSKKDSIIMDFFSGSATTADAVMQCNADDNGNRTFIMVQLPELCEEKSEAYKDGYKTICDIAEDRISRCSKIIYSRLKEKQNDAGLLAEQSCVDPDKLDFGFSIYKLESTNIRPWDSSIKLDENSLLNYNETIKEGRRNIDVAYEIMLKYGVFDMPLKEITISNKQMFDVGEGFMIICLDDNITMENVTEIAKLNPHCVVFKESGFKDDNEKINATYTLERFKVEKVLCI